MTAPARLHPPYIWFGGKRKVAPVVWAALGDVDNYAEPFFGGGSVYLLRPHPGRIETINDMDGFVCNFWRAVQADPEALADAMNWPINEIDMEARHRALCRQPDKGEFLERMKTDPTFHHLERAAWWCWGLNAWIGSGWCGGEYWPDKPGESHGRGVCDGANKRPAVARGRGVHRKMPDVAGGGRGVHRKRPHLGNGGQGVHSARGADLRGWMLALRDRLRNTRVCCGDWERMCTDGAMSHGSTVGVFLDPPYSAGANRDNDIYREEDTAVANRVRQWCIDRTRQARLRIVLCGYEGEHDDLVGLGWRVHAWRTQGGFANFGKQGQGKANCGRERIWFSPSCLAPESATPLFAPPSPACLPVGGPGVPVAARSACKGN